MIEIIKKHFPHLYDKYLMYTFGKGDDACLRDFIITSELFEGINWSNQTPENLRDKFILVEIDLMAQNKI